MYTPTGTDLLVWLVAKRRDSFVKRNKTDIERLRLCLAEYTGTEPNEQSLQDIFRVVTIALANYYNYNGCTTYELLELLGPLSTEYGQFLETMFSDKPKDRTVLIVESCLSRLRLAQVYNNSTKETLIDLGQNK